MNEKRLKELLAYVKTTDLQEVVWQKKSLSVHFRRQPAAVKRAASTASAPTTNGDQEIIVEPGAELIRSTMVGTFHRSDSKERPPFVVEGTVVEAGQPVGAIEAMKIMKDVVATASCKIMKVLVDNGRAVEYGQPLFEVEPQPENV